MPPLGGTNPALRNAEGSVVSDSPHVPSALAGEGGAMKPGDFIRLRRYRTYFPSSPIGDALPMYGDFQAPDGEYTIALLLGHEKKGGILFDVDVALGRLGFRRHRAAGRQRKKA